jgi:hypothetical protein
MRIMAMFLLCNLALAQPRSDEARLHFDEGTKHYNIGEFRQAAAEYTLAYKLKPASVLLYNIAQAHRLAEEPEQALFFYRSYLRNAPGAVNHAEVEDRIKRLEKQLSEAKAIVVDPPNGTVAPIELPAAPSPAPAVSPAPEPIRLVMDPPRKMELHRRWWVWTLAGVAVTGLAVGLGVGLTQPTTSYREVF